MRILDFSVSDEVPRLVEMVTELGPGQHGKGRWQHRRKDGTVFEVEADVVAMESAGRPVCVVLSRIAPG